MQDMSKPANAIASVGRRSFSVVLHRAVRSSVVASAVMAHRKQNLCIDSICTDVAALAMVGANVCEAPDIMLETLRSKGWGLYLLRNVDTAILVFAWAKSIPIHVLTAREAVPWT